MGKKALLLVKMFLLLILFGVKSQYDYMPFDLLWLKLDYNVICSDGSLGQLSKQWLRSTSKNKVCFYFARRKSNHQNDVRKRH